MLSVRSVQIAGVSYDNLGDAGLEWLSEMADGGGRAQVTATLNPAGMDIENWQKLGIPSDFAESSSGHHACAYGGNHHLHLHTLSGRQPAGKAIRSPGPKQRGMLR
jgi:hypothetical protein